VVTEPQTDLFRRLVESVLDYAIFALDAGGHVVTWNEGARRIKGYEADEIIGKHVSVFYSPEEVAAGKPDAELVLASAEGRWEDEGWRIRKDGTRFWANVVTTALRDESGGLVGFGKVTRDMTDRRIAERERLRLVTRERAAKAAAAAAQQAVRARDEFLSVAAPPVAIASG
jgi:PAS domain S-box-containing protein